MLQITDPRIPTPAQTTKLFPAVQELGFAPDFVPYKAGLVAQEAAAERVKNNVDHGTLLLLEHAAVYTAGRRAAPEEYPNDGTPVVPVNRGGKVTWHGPGQLVAYPIIRLRERFGAVDLIRALEGAIINVCAAFDVHGFRVEGRAGVWANARPGAVVSGPTGSDQHPVKVAQIGIHASRHIITHGIAMNCSNDLAPFNLFVPCGIADAGVSTLSELTDELITPARVAPVLRAELETLAKEYAA